MVAVGFVLIGWFSDCLPCFIADHRSENMRLYISLSNERINSSSLLYLVKYLTVPSSVILKGIK
jgi:hypothetical protein